MPTVDSMVRLGWGDPDHPAFREQHIVTVAGAGVRLAVNRGAATLFHLLLNACETGLDGKHKPYALNGNADDWGYANRNIRGGHSKSYHAWGLAVDLNATRNPQGSTHGDMPAWLVMYAENVLGMRWGGHFNTTPDPMHYEVTESRADVKARVISLTAPPHPKKGQHMLIRIEGRNAVYECVGNRRFTIPSPDVLYALGYTFADVHVVKPDHVLAQLPIDKG